MENIGIVREKVGKKVKIEMYASSACGKCDHCSGEHKQPEIIEVDAPFELFEGENVIIEISDNEVLKIGAISYIFPIFGFFTGYVISSFFTKLESYMIISSFVGALVSFLLIGIYDKVHARKKSPFTIKKI